MFARARSWLPEWRRLDSPEAIAGYLKNPAWRDRAPLENALSRHFFHPFVHQEVAEGAAFVRRAALSRAATTIEDHVLLDAARLAGERLVVGEVEDLLAEVRATATRAMVRLVFGDDALEVPTLRAVADFDDAIKMRRRSNSSSRRDLARVLEGVMRDPARWLPDTMLGVASEALQACPLVERVDHVASVFLGTGTIQISDVVTHGLIALAQTPLARSFSEAAVVRETIRRYPVNASLTRRREGSAWKTAVSVVPSRVNRHGWRAPDSFDPGRFESSTPGYCFGFGHGPRACPARRMALLLSAAILSSYRALGVGIEPGYRHRRSLAIPVRASLGGPPPRSVPRERVRDWARYLGRCLATYPTALTRELCRPGGLYPQGGLDRQGGKVPPHSVPQVPKMHWMDCTASSAAPRSPLKQFSTQMRSGWGPPRQL
jgi:cytochrome P450